MDQPRPLDIAASDNAGAGFPELSSSSSSSSVAGVVAEPVAGSKGAAAVIVSGEAPGGASKKRARDEEQPGEEGEAQRREASETSPVPSPNSTSAMNGESVPDESSAAPRPTDSGATPGQIVSTTVPLAKKPRRRKPAAATIALPSMNAQATIPSARPTPSDLPRADEILSALERQAALLERQTRVQEEQNRVMQQLLEFLSRPSRFTPMNMTMGVPPPPGPTQM